MSRAAGAKECARDAGTVPRRRAPCEFCSYYTEWRCGMCGGRPVCATCQKSGVHEDVCGRMPHLGGVGLAIVEQDVPCDETPLALEATTRCGSVRVDDIAGSWCMFGGVQSPQQLHKLLKQVGEEHGTVAVDCAAVAQILLYMRYAQHGDVFMLSFGGFGVWDAVTKWQRRRLFGQRPLCTLQHRLPQLLETADAVYLTFSAEAKPLQDVLGRTFEVGGDWLTVHRKAGKCRFVGLRGDYVTSARSLREWFKWLRVAVVAKLTVSSRSFNLSAEAYNAQEMAMDRLGSEYTFETARILVCGHAYLAAEYDRSGRFVPADEPCS
jgi:hypothetical protein